MGQAQQGKIEEEETQGRRELWRQGAMVGDKGEGEQGGRGGGTRQMSDTVFVLICYANSVLTDGSDSALSITCMPGTPRP